MDRIDNSKCHLPNNVRLACEHCNRFKSDNEQQLFFWDCETPYQENINAMYSVGITADKGLFEDTLAFHISLEEGTTVFFDENPERVMESFENWLIAKSEEIRMKVDRLLDFYIKRIITKKPNMSEEELQQRQENEKARLQNNKAIMYAFCGLKFDFGNRKDFALKELLMRTDSFT